MKKVLALFIAILYLAVSSGLAVEIHHCMGKISDFSLSHSGPDKCGSCGMPKNSNSCCKDEVKFVKLQDSYKLLNVNYELAVPEATISNGQFLVNDQSVCRLSLVHPKGHSPPGYPITSLCILNCVFRI